MIVPMHLLVCDACEDFISDGLTATEARQEGKKEGYVRKNRIDLCAKCAKKQTKVIESLKRH